MSIGLLRRRKRPAESDLYRPAYSLTSAGWPRVCITIVLTGCVRPGAGANPNSHGIRLQNKRRPCGAGGLALLAAQSTAFAQGVLRIGMTASDIPLTTGQTDNGGEGMRVMGYTVYDGLINGT